MSKLEIFDENGYLKVEFINPNYRGLVGWPCEWQGADFVGEPVTMGSSLVCVVGGHNITECHNASQDISIPQFTPTDVPVGELCWVQMKNTDVWNLIPMYKYLLIVHCTTKIHTIVPYLIAETAKHAERLKNWSK